MKNLKNSFGIIVIRSVIIFGFASVLSLTGCATSVPIKSVQMPTIDTSNVERMAIRNFENKSGVIYGVQLANHLTGIAKERIPAIGKFTIVSPTDPSVNGIFTGDFQRPYAF